MTIYDQRLNLIIHRCNDQASIDQAISYHRNHHGIMMECDVRQTKDGVHIGYHNYYFRNRKLSKLNYSELEDHVLTIEHILEQVSPHLMTIHLDVKVVKQNNQWQAAARAEELYALIQKYDMVDRVVISNVKGRFLKKLRELSSRLTLGILYDEDYGYIRPGNKDEVNHFIGHILDTHQQLNIQAVFFNQQWLKMFETKFHLLEKVFYTLVKAGIKIAVWTVNQPQTANLFANRGAAWITTDNPDTIRAMLINPSVQDVRPLL